VRCELLMAGCGLSAPCVAWIPQVKLVKTYDWRLSMMKQVVMLGLALYVLFTVLVYHGYADTPRRGREFQVAGAYAVVFCTTQATLSTPITVTGD